MSIAQSAIREGGGLMTGGSIARSSSPWKRNGRIVATVLGSVILVRGFWPLDPAIGDSLWREPHFGGGTKTWSKEG